MVNRDNFWIGHTTTYLEKAKNILDEQDGDLDDLDEPEQIRKQRARIKEKRQLIRGCSAVHHLMWSYRDEGRFGD